MKAFAKLLAIALLLVACVGAEPFHSPSAMVADASGRTLYIADFTARQVIEFDIAGQSVRRTIALADRPSGVALSKDGGRLFVTTAEPQGKVFVIDARRGVVTATIAVGHTPGGPALSRDGRTLYVCNRYNNNVSVIDVAALKETTRIAVSREPVAAQLSADGNLLFVANQHPSGPSTAKQVASVISVIDTRTNRAASEIRLPDGGASIRGLGLSPDGRFLYVTHLQSRYQAPASQIERGWIQTNAVSLIDATGQKLINTVLLDDINMGAANPWGVVCTPDGKYLVIAHGGTHELSVIDRPALHAKLERARERRAVSDVSASAADVTNDLAFLAGIRTRVPLNGNGPRSLAVIGQSVYAGEYFTGSLSVVDLPVSAYAAVRSVQLGVSPAMTAERRGEMLFHDAQYCSQKWLSCSSCHPNEARPDGLNWDLMLDGVGNAKNTKSLLLSHQTPPTTATGARPNAEASVRAGYQFIQFAQRPEADAVDVDSYLKSLQPMPSPYLVEGKLSPAAERGKKLFQANGCSGCHSGALYTSMKKFNAGTGLGREKGIAFDTPTLIEVWRTAPYLHDGRAATLVDMFTAADSGIHNLSVRLSAKQIEDLAAFVLSL